MTTRMTMSMNTNSNHLLRHRTVLMSCAVLIGGIVPLVAAEDDPPETLTLTGIVRDFQERTAEHGHPDFEQRPVHGFGLYCGNVADRLGDDHTPVFTGEGWKVWEQWKDEDDRPICHRLSCRDEVEDDDGDDQEDEGELEFCEYNIDLNVGDTFDIRDYVHLEDDPEHIDWSEVFFTYTEAGADDPTTPPDWHREDFQAGREVTVVAADRDPGTGNHGRGEYRIYVGRVGQDRYDDHATIRISNDRESEVESARCPEAAEDERGDHRTGKVDICHNGMTLNVGEPALSAHLAHGDTLGECGEDDCGDTAGERGPADTGGVESSASFEQWFHDVPSVNLSKPLAVTFVRQEDGSYVFDDTLDPLYGPRGGFFPIDDDLFGNSGGEPNHNFHFTFELHTEFTYDAGAGQTFRFVGDDDVWVFIDDMLVIDLGGVHPATEQFVDLDRLGLVDGETYPLDFFFAERHRTQSNFRIQTNLALSGDDLAAVTAGFD